MSSQWFRGEPFERMGFSKNVRAEGFGSRGWPEFQIYILQALPSYYRIFSIFEMLYLVFFLPFPLAPWPRKRLPQIIRSAEHKSYNLLTSNDNVNGSFLPTFQPITSQNVRLALRSSF